ncbi:Tudor domain-containing protein 5 [Geodia barretti]|uniref:Tudor domain-containing protein 5 n=1 Tax=Geodia barretti TaxID=519541 RepID=A0AA35U1F1_GEOBA|nr:Tudor domain-containing protein 5 [Geodia barretti]
MTSAGKYAGPQDVPEKLQRNVRAFLLASPKGALLGKFCGEYRRLVKESLPWKSLGYSSAAELLRAMPTAARLHYSQKDGDYRVYPVADSNTYLPSWQKKFEEKNLPILSVPPPSPGLNPGVIKPSMTSSVSLSPRKQTQRPPTPDCASSFCSQKRRREGKGRGEGQMKFFAIHVCFRHAPGGAIDCSVVTANAMQKKLPEVMKDSGTPLKIYISGKGYAFVRFVTLAEALKAIELHHRTYVGKTWITVSPAKESVDRFPVAVVNGNSSVSGGKSEEGIVEWAGDGETHTAGDVRHSAKNGSLVHSKQPSQLQRGSHTSSTGGGSASAVQKDGKSSYQLTGGTACPDSSKRSSSSIYNGSQTAAINGSVFWDEAISQGGSLSSDGSWDEELLVSSPFSSGTELGLQTTTVASVRTSNLSEWNLATPELSPHSMPNSDGLIPVRVSRVESPSLVWVQLTSDPESDVAKLSQIITRLEPPRLTEVCV